MRILIVTMMVLLSLSAKAVEKGDIVIQPNVNFGNYSGWSSRSSQGIGVTLNADFALHDYFSVGPWVGFNSVGKKDFQYSRFGFGARGIFHWWQLLDDKVAKDLKADKIDFYLPLHIGFNVQSSDDDGGSFASSGIGLGFRYYFSPKFGVGLEWGGQEMSYAKLGLAIKI